MKSRMKRVVWITLLISAYWAAATVSRAQDNSYISTTDGFWDEARLWSLAEQPSISQSGIFITNAANVNVTIDNITASNFPDTLTISNLNIYPPGGNNSTLYLANTGTVALHIFDGLSVGFNPNSTAGGSTLISSNSTLIVDGLLGGQLEDNGTLIILGGTLITTNSGLRVADEDFSSNSGLLIISNAVVQAGGLTIAIGDNENGSVEVIGGTVTLSAPLTVGDAQFGGGGSLLVADGAMLVVTNGNTGIGGGFQSNGSMTVTNASFLAANIFLSGPRCTGNLVINNGSVTLSGQLGIGGGDQGSGFSVSLDGGILVVTNDSTGVASAETADGSLTISDGLFLARDVQVGVPFESRGTLFIYGGTSILSSNLQVGFGDSIPTVAITSGQLIVTNGDITVGSGVDCCDPALIGVSGGLLAANYIDIGVGFPDFVHGTLSINNGSVTVSTGITLGDCELGNFGYLNVGGGQVIVTNTAHTAFVDVQDGELTVDGGTLQVDQLVMTNSCSSFVHTGGTLIVGNVILDPNAFRIVSITPQSNDVLVSWLMAPGATNALQASTGTINGSYTTNTFTDIFIVTNNTATGTLTNFLDHGAATNKSRYYRARLSP